MNASASMRILVVAHQTAATPGLLEEVRRRAGEGAVLDLLVPDVPEGEDAESTLALALPLLEEAAGGTVRGFGDGPDAFESIQRRLRQEHYDEVIVSTLPQARSRWLKRNLPRQVCKLGLPVTVVTASAQAGQPVARSLAR